MKEPDTHLINLNSSSRYMSKRIACNVLAVISGGLALAIWVYLKYGEAFRPESLGNTFETFLMSIVIVLLIVLAMGLFLTDDFIKNN